MPRTAIVARETTAIAHTGHSYRLPAGRYEIAKLDGVAERGEMYIHGPDNGDLVQVNPHDPNITIDGI
jgi:hypothetical protein